MYTDLFRSWYYESLSRRSLRLVTEALGEQISLDRAHQHLRLDLYGSPLGHPDDDLLEHVYIPMARGFCEVETGRAFAPQEYELGIGGFGYPHVSYGSPGIALPIGPVISVSSIDYTDAAGTTIILDPASYVLDAYTNRGYVYPANGTLWPSTYPMANAIRVRFFAGYELPGNSPTMYPLPARFMGAMLLMLGHFYENRSATEMSNMLPKELDLGVKALLQPDSLRSGFA